MDKHARLKLARKTRYATAKDAAEALGVPYGTYSGHESGSRGFDEEDAKRYAKSFRVNAGWILMGDGKGPDDGDRRVSRAPLVASFDPDEPDPLAQTGDDRPDAAPSRADMPADAIVELAPRGGMGAGETAITAHSREVNGVTEVDALRPDYWRFPQRFLNETLRRPASSLIVIECEGDSMKPTLSPGERVWVDTSHRIPSPDGIYALRDRFENIVIKRVQLDESVEPPVLLIQSDNPSHQTISRTLDQVHIVGRVVGGFRML